jgi:hypothetical protein
VRHGTARNVQQHVAPPLLFLPCSSPNPPIHPPAHTPPPHQCRGGEDPGGVAATDGRGLSHSRHHWVGCCCCCGGSGSSCCCCGRSYSSWSRGQAGQEGDSSCCCDAQQPLVQRGGRRGSAGGSGAGDRSCWGCSGRGRRLLRNHLLASKGWGRQANMPVNSRYDETCRGEGCMEVHDVQNQLMYR